MKNNHDMCGKYWLMGWFCVLSGLVIVAAMLSGCSTNPEYYKAQQEFYKQQAELAQQPAFECRQCTGVKISRGAFGGSKQSLKPLPAPTNGWDMGKAIIGGLVGIANKNGQAALGVVALDKVASAMVKLGSGKQGDVVTNTTTTNTQADTTTTQKYSNEQSYSALTEKTIQYNADNGAQLSGGDSIRESGNTATENTQDSYNQRTDSVSGSYNPSTNKTYPVRGGSAP